MNYRLLDLLRCPFDGMALEIHPFRHATPHHTPVKAGVVRCQQRCARLAHDLPTDPKPEAYHCAACFREEIIEGVLRCVRGHIFPVVGGVPRLTLDALQEHRTFTTRWCEELRALAGKTTRQTVEAVGDAVGATAGTRDSFGREWAIFRHGEDRTWGWDRETRRKRVLIETGLKPDEFEIKRVLDAGCGNGVLTSAIGDMGGEVIGIDISQSVGEAFAQNRNPHVHYIQGDLMHPPLRAHSIDLLYSSGVLHHTPNTEATFACLVPLLKRGGRFYLWLYHPQKSLKHRIMIRLRLIVVRLPARFQYYVLSAFTWLALGKRALLRSLNLTNEPPVNRREQLINFYDGLTPPYRFEHTQEEVRRWFLKHEFTNACTTIVETFGFGMYADWNPKEGR